MSGPTSRLLNMGSGCVTETTRGWGSLAMWIWTRESLVLCGSIPSLGAGRASVGMTLPSSSFSMIRHSLGTHLQHLDCGPTPILSDEKPDFVLLHPHHGPRGCSAAECYLAVDNALRAARGNRPRDSPATCFGKVPPPADRNDLNDVDRRIDFDPSFVRGSLVGGFALVLSSGERT